MQILLLKWNVCPASSFQFPKIGITFASSTQEKASDSLEMSFSSSIFLKLKLEVQNAQPLHIPLFLDPLLGNGL